MPSTHKELVDWIIEHDYQVKKWHEEFVAWLKEELFSVSDESLVSYDEGTTRIIKETLGWMGEK